MTRSLLQQSVLQAVQIGLAVPPDSAAEVAAELEPVTCRGGDWLFRQGDPADGLYLLVRGRLQVWIDTPESDNSTSRLVAEVSPVETVGEIGMLAGGMRSAGIRAMRDSLLLTHEHGRVRSSCTAAAGTDAAARRRDRHTVA